MRSEALRGFRSPWRVLAKGICGGADGIEQGRMDLYMGSSLN